MIRGVALLALLALAGCKAAYDDKGWPVRQRPYRPPVSEQCQRESAEVNRWWATGYKEDDAFKARIMAGIDPAIEAERALAAGEWRLVTHLVDAPGAFYDPIGIECRPARLVDRRALSRANSYPNDVPPLTEAQAQRERQEAERFGRFAQAYNRLIVTDPSYPYRDICRPVAAGYRRTGLPPEHPPVEAYGYRDLQPSTAPVDLGEAARRGTRVALRARIAADPGQINRADAFGMTPLAWAIAYRRDAAIDALLAAGADPVGSACARVNDRTSPMQIAKALGWRSLLSRMQRRIIPARREPLEDLPVG